MVRATPTGDAVRSPQNRAGLWWGLWAMLASLPWLVPTHAQPWTSFHADAAMAGVAAPLLAWAVVASSGRFIVPFEAAILAGLGVVPLLQWALGLIVFAGDAWLAGLYVLGLAVAIVLGARFQQLQPWAVPNALFTALGIAAVVSVLLMFAQWTQWDGLGTLLLSLPEGARLSGNLGQPNQLATLLVWGMLAVWWAYLRCRAPGVLIWVTAALLLLGVAMTQSRAGALQLLLIGFAAMLFRRQLRVHEYAVSLLALGAWFLAAAIGWAPLNDVLRPGQVQALEERLAPGTRLLHWSLLQDAVAARPWTGWGWNQIVHAQWELAPLHPASHEVVQYGHNLFLDLLLWNGVAIGIVAMVSIIAWCIWQTRLARTAERVLALLFVLVFLLHAMVELPHGYLLFLIPVGLMVGVLHEPLNRLRDLPVARKTVALLFVVPVLGMVVTIKDYSRIEDAWMAHRFSVARIGTQTEVAVPDAIALSNMQALLNVARTEPRALMSTDDLDLLRQTSRRYPSPGGLFRYAWAAALNGSPAEATKTLVMLCHVHSVDQCAAAKEAWLLKSEQSGLENNYMARIWPAAF